VEDKTFEYTTILDAIAKLSRQIAALSSFEKETAYSSENINELAQALAKAQGEYKSVGFNRENPYFKSGYADLDAIMKAVRPALAKNSLAFIQQTQITKEGATMLHSKLMHSSGQWLEARNRIVPAKNDAQTYGSTMSYHKRYAAMALLGVTVSQDSTDDDAEVAMIPARDIIAKGPSNAYNPKQESPETVTKEQLEELEYELADAEDLVEEVLDKLQLQSLADLPKSKYMVTIKRIREIKELRKGRR